MLIVLVLAAAAVSVAADREACGDRVSEPVVTDHDITVGSLTVWNTAESLFVTLEALDVSRLLHTSVRVSPTSGSGTEASDDADHRGDSAVTYEFALEWPAGTELGVEATLEMVGLDSPVRMPLRFTLQGCGNGSGDQGCSPAFWEGERGEWRRTGLSADDRLESVFRSAAEYASLRAVSLSDALEFEGGEGVEGTAAVLLRAGVAAMLNAGHPRISFAYKPDEVVDTVNDALASGNLDRLRAAAESLEQADNMGCPLG